MNVVFTVWLLLYQNESEIPRSAWNKEIKKLLRILKTMISIKVIWDTTNLKSLQRMSTNIKDMDRIMECV